MKNTKIWITSWPHGRAEVVEVIEERKDKKGYFYIRKESGGTDTTRSDFLFDMPNLKELEATFKEANDIANESLKWIEQDFWSIDETNENDRLESLKSRLLSIQ